MNSSVNNSALSAAGRFSRLSYLGWNGLLLIAVMLLGFLCALLLQAVSPGETKSLSMPALILLGAVYAVMLYFTFIFTIRRLHDRNHSGWLSLLMLVPFANIILALYLIFAKGDAHANQFGPPRAALTWEKVLGWIYVLIFPIGITAAIAIPAYHDYAQRAQQAQIELQRPAE
ncbi:DUF805 domain-containing protein [Acinetobacter sp.]|uniref:DUF805 domain-containing protein n=1 Tax=Acinetobacter sp. TaxID=472 RepID=UPI002FC5BE9F